jgi:hypothetical protein
VGACHDTFPLASEVSTSPITAPVSTCNGGFPANTCVAVHELLAVNAVGGGGGAMFTSSDRSTVGDRLEASANVYDWVEPPRWTVTA